MRMRSWLYRLPMLVAGIVLANAAEAATAPELTGITGWINTAPLTLAGLRGKVVLVDFWAFECINCLHALPQVKALNRRYAAQGLVVLGVHTPELPDEYDTAQLKDAVQRLGIAFPVAQDNKYATWNAWHNRYWPAQYVIDRKGRIVYQHIGEGGYEQIEQAVRNALAAPAA